jgi:hypothetical protein
MSETISVAVRLRQLPLSGGGECVAAPSRRVMILTHHKCASTFVGFYLEQVCALNHLRLFRSHRATDRPNPECDISLLTNVTYDRIKNAIDAPAIHIIRNPLDIITSAYNSHRSTHGLDGWPHLQHQRRILANCNKEVGLHLTLAFLERAEFYPGTPGPLHALGEWCFNDARIRTIRMEDLVTDVTAMLGGTLIPTLGGAITLPDEANFTFERITGGRRIGEVDDMSHYRSGKPGSWREDLPDSIIAYVRAHFHELLSRYYPDSLE